MQFAPLYPLLYKVLKPQFPGCLWSGSEKSRNIALTFDDGPHPQYTPELLKVLDHYSISASFFCLGVCVNRAPAIAKAIYDRGHWLGVHGYDHRSFPLLSSPELKRTLQQTQSEIASACQITPEFIRDVRPPNGLFTPKTLSLLNQWNYRPVMWSVVPEDWVTPGINTVIRRVLKQVRNGSLIVLHDGYHGGEDVAETANQLIPMLIQQDYRFVTVHQLWKTR
ncbi:MAG: polysaccharide deacetylase family protein [Kovacikia sp.]